MTQILKGRRERNGLIPPPLRNLATKLRQPKSAKDRVLPARGNVTYRDLQNRLLIPVNSCTPDQLENDKLTKRGTRLARNEDWDALSDQIRTADRDRSATRSGTPFAELLMFGGRSDVVRAAEHALLHGRPAAGSDFFSGVEALEGELMERPDDYAIALIVAHMHIDIGWAWRGAGPREDVQAINREAFEAHFDRAADIVAELSPKHENSPALAAARCALLPGRIDPGPKLLSEFEHLISLDPMNPRHMRAFGNYLLPRWYGDFPTLDLQARRAAANLLDQWGAGAYTWGWFDALLVDIKGFETVEVDYFLEGAMDILARVKGQHVANLMAAHLFRSWQIARQNYHDTGARPELAPALRRGFETVVHDHLREVHPLIWGHAEIGFENTARIISPERLARQGREIALGAVAMPFLKGLQSGQRVSFSPEGITVSQTS